MSQTVKLKDGSYIDASGVWDKTIGKTQEAINNECAEYFIPTGVDVASYNAERCTVWRRKGMLIVTFSFALNSTITGGNHKRGDNRSASVIRASDLGIEAFNGGAYGTAYLMGPYLASIYAVPGWTELQLEIATDATAYKLESAAAYGSICIPLLS